VLRIVDSARPCTQNLTTDASVRPDEVLRQGQSNAILGRIPNDMILYDTFAQTDKLPPHDIKTQILMTRVNLETILYVSQLLRC